LRHGDFFNATWLAHAREVPAHDAGVTWLTVGLDLTGAEIFHLDLVRGSRRLCRARSAGMCGIELI